MEKEPISNSKFIIYIKPGGVTYNLTTVKEIIDEVNFRLRKHNTKLKPIKRPLYGMNLLGFVNGEVLKMVQVVPTQVYVERLYADLPKGERLYVEEGDGQVFLSMLVSEDDQGFSDFAGVI